MVVVASAMRHSHRVAETRAIDPEAAALDLSNKFDGVARRRERRRKVTGQASVPVVVSNLRFADGEYRVVLAAGCEAAVCRALFGQACKIWPSTIAHELRHPVSGLLPGQPCGVPTTGRCISGSWVSTSPRSLTIL
jgi:hypothetical protein